MTAEAQRLAIAQACGWTDIDVQGEYCFGTEAAKSELDARQFMMELPHYCSDLNAIHEAEKTLPDSLFVVYANKLAPCATAAQRAEAFLRTLNLWS
jgi:hypothetical protein